MSKTQAEIRSENQALKTALFAELGKKYDTTASDVFADTHYADARKAIIRIEQAMAGRYSFRLEVGLVVSVQDNGWKRPLRKVTYKLHGKDDLVKVAAKVAARIAAISANHS